MPLILGANSATGNYTVKDSLRFNSGSSDYLSRTPASAGNQQTWTWSGWVKRAILSSDKSIFSVAGSSNATYFLIKFDSNNCIYIGNYSTNFFITTQVFRDLSAWYHIVIALDTTQATAANRLVLYVNGSQVTSFSSNNIAAQIAQNSTQGINEVAAHNIGREAQAGVYLFDGYISEVNFIDGQALTPSSFGQTDPSTPSSGIWIPKAYTGTYGTNGFYLKFLNSASLGTDSSGNGNNWTSNGGIASTSQSTDTPSNNFATWNPNLAMNSTMSVAYGNLAGTTGTNYASGASNCWFSTIGMSSGKWYAEFKLSALTAGAAGMVGVAYDLSTFQQGSAAGMYSLYDTVRGWGYIGQGPVKNNGTTIYTGSTYTTGDIIGIALDITNNRLYFSKNGTWQNSADPTTGTGAISITSGQDYFFGASDAGLTDTYTFQANYGSPMYSSNGYKDGAGYGNFSYAVPSGYYALCSANLAKYG